MRTKTNPTTGGGAAAATLEPPAVTQAPTPPKAGGLKKITFGKIATKKEDTKTAYPVFEDGAVGKQVADIAARMKQRAREIEALEGANKTDRAELLMFTMPFYFKTNRNKAEPPSSIEVRYPAGKDERDQDYPAGHLLVTLQNRYTKVVSDEPLRAVLGDKVEDYFRQTFSLVLNGESLPKGREQQIVDELQALLEKHQCLSALEVKDEIKPTPDFHVRRHTDFTPEQNLSINAVCPIVAVVKTKGRGE